MDEKLDKLKPSPPIYYQLELPQQIKPVYDFLTPKAILALETLGYMAMQDIEAFDER